MRTHTHFRLRQTIPFALALAVSVLISGCCASSHLVSSAGNTAVGAVKGAGKTASAATRAAGKVTISVVGTAGEVVHSSVNAAGDVAKATVGAAAGIATAPFVLFKDSATGKTCGIPWRDGMTLAVAMQESKWNAGLTAIKILRGNEAIRPKANLALKSGDVVEVASEKNSLAVAAPGDL